MFVQVVMDCKIKQRDLSLSEDNMKTFPHRELDEINPMKTPALNAWLLGYTSIWNEKSEWKKLIKWCVCNISDDINYESIRLIIKFINMFKSKFANTTLGDVRGLNWVFDELKHYKYDLNWNGNEGIKSMMEIMEQLFTIAEDGYLSDIGNGRSCIKVLQCLRAPQNKDEIDYGQLLRQTVSNLHSLLLQRNGTINLDDIFAVYKTLPSHGPNFKQVTIELIKECLE